MTKKIEYEPASFSDRVFGGFIDLMLFILICAIAVIGLNSGWGLLFGFLYYTILDSGGRQTIGRMTYNGYIVNKGDFVIHNGNGEDIGFIRAFLRSVFFMFFHFIGLNIMFNWIIMLTNEDRRGLQDVVFFTEVWKPKLTKKEKQRKKDKYI